MDRPLMAKVKDAFLVAVMTVALIFGAAALLDDGTNALVAEVAENTRVTRQLLQAQTCLLALDIEDRAALAEGCYRAAGLSPDVPDIPDTP